MRGCGPAAGYVEHLETTAAARRNDLLEKRERPVWRFIRKAQQNNRQPRLPTRRDRKAGAQAPVRTPAGRVIGPAFMRQTRRQQVLLLADEVMRAIAYDLVASGLTLAAVVDNQFVLEIPESQATEGFLEEVGQLARRRTQGPGPLCGTLPVRCYCPVVTQPHPCIILHNSLLWRATGLNTLGRNDKILSEGRGFPFESQRR